ncbi:MAG: PTS glucose/sucrose transporter subunit IIB, partial [Anaerorhabdus sp.]
MTKKNYEEIANQILDLIGGKENISYCTHCVTRLRITTKDKSRIKTDEINKVSGVVGTQWSGEQFQIIIG